MGENYEEDFEKMAAMLPTEDTYFKTGVFIHAKNRILWLLILMLSSTITGAIIQKYENAFAAIPILVSFIPMIMDTRWKLWFTKLNFNNKRISIR